MGRLASAIATVGGLGRLPAAPGTLGSVVGALLGWWTALQPSWLLRLGCVAAGVVIGVLASGAAARDRDAHDPADVVIDEVVGMWAVFAVMPQLIHTGWFALLAFGLFRAFDIFKPPPLKLLERLPGGWGILLDDLGAAAYTCLIVWLAMTLIPHG